MLATMALSKEPLDTDRLNFLVWRYLLESNYRETAAKLQKEWHVASPHKQFAFAPHIQNQALVLLVNRGLTYHALQREYTRTKLGTGDGLDAEPQMGLFGPIGYSSAQPQRQPIPDEQDKQPTGNDQQPEQTPALPKPQNPELQPDHRPTQPHQPLGSHHHHLPLEPVHGDTAKQPPITTTTGTTTTPAGTIGAEPIEQARDRATDDTASAYEADLSRKRALDNNNRNPPLVNGNAIKRPRLSNGYENGVVNGSNHDDPNHTTAAATGAMPMEIDQSEHHLDNNHAYPSPLEGERAPTPVAHTEGPQQGTQVDKVQELMTETVFLRLTGDDGAEPASPQHQVSIESGNGVPVLLHCEWSPSDSSSLVVAGTDSLARLWTAIPSHSAAAAAATTTTTTAIGSEQQQSLDAASHATTTTGTHATPAGQGRSFHDLVSGVGGVGKGATATALDWNRDGSAIAIATDQGGRARIDVWGSGGQFIYGFDGAESPVIKLRWNPNNSALLSISPDNGGTIVTVYDSDTASLLSRSFRDYDLLSSAPLDATWINETDFLLCGGDLFLALRCSNSEIEVTRTFDRRPDDNFGHILYDWRSKLVATSNDRGVFDLWDEHGQRRSISAHTGNITAIEWQPLKTNTVEDERLIASGGDDCAILLWNARMPESRPKCCLTMDSPIVSLAFTPDGAFLAGATAHQVLIWKVGEYTMPRASWTRAPHPGWLSPKAVSDVDEEEEDEYCLCWDSTGQKLAYGANSRLAVIRFR